MPYCLGVAGRGSLGVRARVNCGVGGRGGLQHKQGVYFEIIEFGQEFGSHAHPEDSMQKNRGSRWWQTIELVGGLGGEGVCVREGEGPAVPTGNDRWAALTIQKAHAKIQAVGHRP